VINVRKLVLALVVAIAWRAPAQTIPTRLDDSTFWRMMTEFSEPWGVFRSENFVSNETSYQWIIPELAEKVQPGGVYLGVAPDQNFTYIVNVKPRIAFIVDIRHQNAMQHLMYKALIEMSNSRAEFLTKLFARKSLPTMDVNAPVHQLFDALANTQADSATYRDNLAAIKDWLITHHHFALSDSEKVSLDCVYGAFFTQGPTLTYNYSSECRNPFAGFRGGPGNFNGGGRMSGMGGMPSYLGMMTERDGGGADRGYLATENNFHTLKEMEERNLIVPLTGNFAGDRALRTVGQWVRERNAAVTSFYVSNVEQYLFMQGDEAERFYKNVSLLPLDSTSTFIRSYSMRGFVGPNGTALKQQSGFSAQLISSIKETLKAYDAGQLAAYWQVIALSHQ
jgi:hypothetical protein